MQVKRPQMGLSWFLVFVSVVCEIRDLIFGSAFQIAFGFMGFCFLFFFFFWFLELLIFPCSIC